MGNGVQIYISSALNIAVVLLELETTNTQRLVEILPLLPWSGLECERYGGALGR